MSLLNNRALISHLVVIELLHDVQLVASARGPKRAAVKQHIRIHNGIVKNTQQGGFEEGVHVLKSFLLCRIKIALRLTLSGVIAVHDLKPIYCSCAPPFILHPLKSRRLQKRSKTTRSKLPVIRFLDWIVEYMSNLL